MSLPDDVIPDILSWLPVKALLRFRSVSKQWRSLIDGPAFTKLHKTHSDNNRGAIVGAGDSDLYWINLHSPGSAMELPNPIADSDMKTEVIGSCNGLVALQNLSGGHVKDAAILNPATRWYQRVPIPESTFGATSSALIGFGHDPDNDEYKLVRLLAFYDPVSSDVEEFAFMVYSATTNTWKTFEGQSFTGCVMYGQALVENAIHWIVTPCHPDESKPVSIFAFDVGTELFCEIPKPDYDSESTCEDMYYLFLRELRGGLCLACKDKSRLFHVWRMNKYCVGGSWSKLFSVGTAEMGGPFAYVEPLAFVRDRVLLDIDGKVLALYDPCSKSAEIVRIPGVDRYRDVCTFAESLARVNLPAVAPLKEEPKRSSEKLRDGIQSKGFKLKL